MSTIQALSLLSPIIHIDEEHNIALPIITIQSFPRGILPTWQCWETIMTKKTKNPTPEVDNYEDPSEAPKKVSHWTAVLAWWTPARLGSARFSRQQIMQQGEFSGSCKSAFLMFTRGCLLPVNKHKAPIKVVPSIRKLRESRFSRIFLTFHLPISRHFHFTFHSRSQGIFISLFILEIREGTTYHFSCF